MPWRSFLKMETSSLALLWTSPVSQVMMRLVVRAVQEDGPVVM